MLTLDIGIFNNDIDWEGVKILDQETVDIKRKIKEAIHIRRQRPTPNKDGVSNYPLFLIICCHVTTLKRVSVADEDYKKQSKAAMLQH